MDLTTLVSGHLRYLGLGSPLIGNQLQSNLQAPVWRLGRKRQLAQHKAPKATTASDLYTQTNRHRQPRETTS